MKHSLCKRGLIRQSLGIRNSGSSYDRSLPASDQFILTRCPEAAVLLTAIIVPLIEAGRVSGPQLSLMNPVSIATSYTRRTVPVGDLGLGRLRIAPLYSAHKAFIFKHHSLTPKPNAIAESRTTTEMCPLGAMSITIDPKKQTRSKKKMDGSCPVLSKVAPVPVGGLGSALTIWRLHALGRSGPSPVVPHLDTDPRQSHSLDCPLRPKLDGVFHMPRPRERARAHATRQRSF